MLVAFPPHSRAEKTHCSESKCQLDTYLCHHHILAFLHIFPICLHHSLQEAQVLDVAAMCLHAVYKVLYHPLAELTAQEVIVHEDVPHGLCLQELQAEEVLLYFLSRETWTLLLVITLVISSGAWGLLLNK